MTWIDMTMQKWTNLRCQFLRDYNRQNNSKESGFETYELFQSTWKWSKWLEFLKSGEIVLKSNVETIDLNATHQSVRNWRANSLKKSGCLKQKYGNFKLKTGRAYGGHWKCFWENCCWNVKTNEPLTKNYRTLKDKWYSFRNWIVWL